MLLSLAIYLKQHSSSAYLAKTVRAPEVDAAIVGLNDDDLLREIGQQSPALQAEYADNLRRVNQYIVDAKNIVAADPNDDEARRSLMEAYQEKAMLFELALDRSLQ